MVKCFPELKYFTLFLKYRSLISKIRRSKVTDYVAYWSRFLNRIPFNVVFYFNRGYSLRKEYAPHMEREHILSFNILRKTIDRY